VLKVPLYYINLNYLSSFENIMNLLNLFFSISNEYVVGVTNFFHCVSLIELDAQENE